MGCCLSKCRMVKESNIEVLDFIAQGSRFSYLRSQGTTTVGIDNKWNIPVVGVNFEGWYEPTIHLWPKDNAQTENLLQLKRAPLPPPDVSSLESSGYDIVF